MSPIMPEPPEQPASTHDTRPPLPVRPTAGTSPMVDRISSDVTEIHVMPAFGGRLHLAFFGNSGQPETAVDSVLAVTIHGDGHIEWHTDAEAATPRAARGGEAA